MCMLCLHSFTVVCDYLFSVIVKLEKAVGQDSPS